MFSTRVAIKLLTILLRTFPYTKFRIYLKTASYHSNIVFRYKLDDGSEATESTKEIEASENICG